MAEPQNRLVAAEFIADISRVAYPKHINSPRIELNANAQAGKFRYDRDFLLQFMDVCKNRPDSLPPLEAFGLDPLGLPSARGGERKSSPRTNSLPKQNRKLHKATLIECSVDEPSSNEMCEEMREEVEARVVIEYRPAGRRTENVAIVEVQALLNILTLERFGYISNLIIRWVNSSDGERDARTLVEVTRLVIDKAINEAARCHLYACLCHMMVERISPTVMERGICNAEGQAVAGGQLFRKLLLNRCQDEFERGCTANINAVRLTAASTAKSGEMPGNQEDCSFESAKRPGSGLVRFIGELFKLQILTERLMHGCITKLLINAEDPGKEAIESLCTLLETVGERLDTNARSHMDIYFRRVEDLSANSNIDSRLRSMLLAVFELRSRNWVPRSATIAPNTNSATEKQVTKKPRTARRMNQMPLGGSKNDASYNTYDLEKDLGSWPTPAGHVPSSVVNDVSRFGKAMDTASGIISPGLWSTIASKKDSEKLEFPSPSRTNSSNAFAARTERPSASAANSSPATSSPNPSTDLSGAGGNADGPHRKLKLLPRTKPLRELKAD